MNDMVTKDDLLKLVRSAGLAEADLCLHASLKSFGKLEGGPDTLLESFLDSGCTVMVPAFTYACETAAPAGREIMQNGMDAGGGPAAADAETFDGVSGMISPEMGAVPASVLTWPGCRRGNHPLNSFAAIGPHADALVRDQSPQDVYAPLRALEEQPGSRLVLAGVDLRRATAVHLAEARAGRRLFRRWAKTRGRVVECAVGSCSEGFVRLEDGLRGLAQVVHAGASEWRLYPFMAFVERAAEIIREKPEITRCDDPACPRCRDAVLGGPLLAEKESQ